MRQFILILLHTLLYTNTLAQSDSITIPNEDYAVYQYDSLRQTTILTYQYPNLWDMDGDKQMDNIVFIGNGGAHTYFHLQIWLTSKRRWNEYSTFYIDMPYLEELESSDELNSPYPLFAVLDFDGDGLDEIFLNLDNPFASIPKELVEQGVTSKQILIDYENSELVVKRFRK